MIYSEKHLSPLAAKSSDSKGRAHIEESHPYRSDFQRDRERIIHSSAFRRLEYKTQVFINHEGDHYRTRLTHTIEVAQISRTIARTLLLNEDLAESIALAHDLGHTPFGHAGERVLNQLLKNFGGFEHNRQSLRVVELLEKRYRNFDGLNLTWETREGIIKHSSEHDDPQVSNYDPLLQPSIEAQIIDLADEIAYNNHDMDDGIASGLLDINEVRELALWHQAEESAQIKKHDKIATRETIRHMINILVTDLIDSTRINIKKYNLKNYQDVVSAKTKVVGFSEDICTKNRELKNFLRKKLYHHYKVERMTIKAANVVTQLFETFTDYPETLPDEYRERIKTVGLQRVSADYIAGMTDRFAIEEYKRLTDPLLGG
jgi:dGTPase